MKEISQTCKQLCLQSLAANILSICLCFVLLFRTVNTRATINSSTIIIIKSNNNNDNNNS